MHDPRRKHALVCARCLQPFFGFSPAQQFCSYACSSGDRRGKPKYCRQCGREFYARGTKRQYCSLDCWYAVPRATEADFWVLVDTSPHPNGCWLWQGALRKKREPYGSFGGMLVHRYAYLLYHPDELLTQTDLICHTCDNPPCVRDEHLFKGTYLDNNRDAVSKGRNAHGEQHYGAKLTDQIVVSILREYGQGGVTQGDLCRRYAISRPVMSSIIHGTAWKHIAREGVL